MAHGLYPPSQLDQLLRAYPGPGLARQGNAQGAMHKTANMLQKPQGNVLPAAPPTPPVPVKRYELAPPANRWLHTSLDGKALDYADFYPQKPNQVEDILNEASVRQGLMDRPFLNNETLSAYDLLVDRVKSDSTLATMTAFAGEVIRTKADARIFPKDVPQKVPFRANLSDANREQWIRDLKDPHIPLHVLEKTIPQGYKGDRLLEVLVVHQIPLVRATWFVKMVTVAESVSQKSKEKETNTTEWTRVVENSLQRFLADLSPPAPRPSANTDAPGLASPARAGSGRNATTESTGSNASSQSSPVALNHGRLLSQSPEARTTFITKWKYLLKLARYHFVENLVDQKEFLQWILRQIRSATFDQTSLLLILISDYIDDMAKSRSLMRTFVEIALGRMERLRGSSPGGILESDQVVAVQYLEWVRIVQRCILAAPEAVVSPKWWSTCERVVENILLDVEAPDEMLPAYSALASSVLHSLYKRIRQRNSAFQTSPILHQTPPDRIIGLLDRTDVNTDLQSLTCEIFPEPREVERDCAVIQRALQWATVRHPRSLFRAHLVAGLVRRYTGLRGEELDGKWREEVESAVFGFLDEFIPGNDGEWQSVADVVGELMRTEVVSWQGYAQWLIVRGRLQGNETENDTTLRHLRHLRALPFAPSEILGQLSHRAALLDEHDMLEDLSAFRIACTAVAETLPGLCKEPSLAHAPKLTMDQGERPFRKAGASLMATLNSLQRFWQLELSRWLLELIRQRLSDGSEALLKGPERASQWTSVNSRIVSLSLEEIAITTLILETVGDYESLLEICLLLLQKKALSTPKLCSVVGEIFVRNKLIFALMDQMGVIWQAMISKLQELHSEGLLDLEPTFLRCLVEMSRVRVCTLIQPLGDLEGLLRSPTHSEFERRATICLPSEALYVQRVPPASSEFAATSVRSVVPKLWDSKSAHEELIQVLGARMDHEIRESSSSEVHRVLTAQAEFLGSIQQITGLVEETLLMHLKSSLDHYSTTFTFGTCLLSADDVRSSIGISLVTALIASGALSLERILSSYIFDVMMQLIEELRGTVAPRKDFAPLYLNVLRLLRGITVVSFDDDPSLAMSLDAQRAIDATSVPFQKIVFTLIREMILIECLVEGRTTASPPASPSPFPVDLGHIIRIMLQEISNQAWFSFMVASHTDYAYSVLIVPTLKGKWAAQLHGHVDVVSKFQHTLSVGKIPPEKFMLIAEEILFTPFKAQGAELGVFFSSLKSLPLESVQNNVLATSAPDFFRWIVDQVDEWNIESFLLCLNMVMDYLTFSAKNGESTPNEIPSHDAGMLGVLSPASTVPDVQEHKNDSNPLSAFVEVLVRNGVGGAITPRILAMILEKLDISYSVAVFQHFLAFLQDVRGGLFKVFTDHETFVDALLVCLQILEKSGSEGVSARYDLLEQLRLQLEWFLNHSRELEIVVSCSMSFEDAHHIVQGTSEPVTSIIDSVNHQARASSYQMYLDNGDVSSLTFGLSLRLHLLSSLVANYQSLSGPLKLTEWLRTLFFLLDIPLLRRFEPDDNPLLEVLVDLLSFFLDASFEASKEVKVSVNALLKEVSTFHWKDPQILARVGPILPFTQSNSIPYVRGQQLLEETGSDISAFPLGLFGAKSAEEPPQMRIMGQF